MSNKWGRASSQSQQHLKFDRFIIIFVGLQPSSVHLIKAEAYALHMTNFHVKVLTIKILKINTLAILIRHFQISQTVGEAINQTFGAGSMGVLVHSALLCILQRLCCEGVVLKLTALFEYKTPPFSCIVLIRGENLLLSTTCLRQKL
jgi:hypothetical protein